MKRLIVILLAATAIFIGTAMVQEWQVFAGAWFGRQRASPTLGKSEKAEISAAVRHYLTVSTHLYRSNGDPRFAERLPATPQVRDDVMADIVYLRHNGRYQEPTLERLTTDDFRRLGPDAVEVVTREYWIIRTRRLADGTESDPIRSSVVRVRYRMTRQAGSWIVQWWRLEDDGPGA